MTRLVLVKHAMPTIDEAKPSREWALSPRGRVAAAALAGKLKDLGLTHMVASPEPKAEETAMEMGKVLGLTCAVDPGLVEHRREGVPFQSGEAFEGGIRALFLQPETRVFGEESADEAHDRFTTALMMQRMDKGPLLAVAHGTVITLFVTRRFPSIEPLPYWRALTLPCAVVLDDGAQPRLVQV